MDKIRRMNLILTLSLFFWVVSTGSSAAERLQEENHIQKVEHLYVLSFDKWGVLTNPAELEYAIQQLSEDAGIERVVILSYGWANDGRKSYSTYRKLVDQMSNPERNLSKTAVIAVGWDSSQSGFRKLFGDIIPLPAISEALAWLPDKLLTGLSFWSKAAYADRIGYGGLQ